MATQSKPHHDAHDIARTLLGAPLGGLLDETFRLMEVAEDEIAQAKSRSPEHAEKLHGGFCVHRVMSNTDSGASRTPIPTEAEHRFRAARTA
jgi:uncharacterized protein YcfJ